MLLGHQFTLQTNHSGLRNLLNNKLALGRLAQWSIKLQEIDVEVKHRKGTEQGNADFLSRLEQIHDGSYQIKMVGLQAKDDRIRTAPDGTGTIFWMGEPNPQGYQQTWPTNPTQPIRVQLQMDKTPNEGHHNINPC